MSGVGGAVIGGLAIGGPGVLMVGSTLAADVAAWLGQQTPSPAVVSAARAAQAWLVRQRPDLALPAATDTWQQDVRLGATILAARLVSRQGTPVGHTPGFDGGGVSILRSDSDVERLCGVGRARKPGGLG